MTIADEHAGGAARRRRTSRGSPAGHRGRRGCAPRRRRRRSTSPGRRGRAGPPSGSRAGPRSTSAVGRAACRPARPPAPRGTMNIFCPKPPPTSPMITRTRFSGTPSARARKPRAPCGPWVESHTTSSPRQGSQSDDEPPGLHRRADVPVLRERLGDDVRGAREDRVQLGIGGGRETHRHVGVQLGVHQRRPVGHRRVHVDDGLLGLDLHLDERAPRPPRGSGSRRPRPRSGRRRTARRRRRGRGTGWGPCRGPGSRPRRRGCGR